MTKKVAPLLATSNATVFRRPPCSPSLTIRLASYECHDELPRWSKMGVDTGPFKLCIEKLFGGPASIFISVRFGWAAWMVLRKRPRGAADQPWLRGGGAGLTGPSQTGILAPDRRADDGERAVSFLAALVNGSGTTHDA